MIDKDIKEVAHFRKKLNGRRLEYDYKRGKLKSGSKGVTDDEVQASYEKLEESIQLGTKWLKLLENTWSLEISGSDFPMISQFPERALTEHSLECSVVLSSFE